MEKREAEQAIREKLKQIEDEISQKNQRLEELMISDSDLHGSVKNIVEKLEAEKAEVEEGLDESGRAVLAKRKKLNQKIKRCKLWKRVFFWGYALLSAYGFYLLNGISQKSLVPYLTLAAIVEAVCLIASRIAKAVYRSALKKTYSDPCMLEFDKKIEALNAKFEEKKEDWGDSLSEIREEKEEIEAKLQELSEAAEDLAEDLKDLDFNFANRDCILFYGKDRGNRYDLYLDGLLYDTVPGRRVVRIMLTPGLHSFKVENKAYNIVDKSLDYCYTFSTRQYLAGEDLPKAWAIVCQFKTIEGVRGWKFEEITKTNLS